MNVVSRNSGPQKKSRSAILSEAATLAQQSAALVKRAAALTHQASVLAQQAAALTQQASGPEGSPGSQPTSSAMTASDPVSAEPSPATEFQRLVITAIQTHLPEPGFSVAALADELALSSSQLWRRVQEEFGTTPTLLIRSHRLDRAAQMLDERPGSISEIAFATGFSSLSYFSRCFRSRFGMAPSEYVNRTATDT